MPTWNDPVIFSRGEPFVAVATHNMFATATAERDAALTDDTQLPAPPGGWPAQGGYIFRPKFPIATKKYRLGTASAYTEVSLVEWRHTRFPNGIIKPVVNPAYLNSARPRSPIHQRQQNGGTWVGLGVTAPCIYYTEQEFWTAAGYPDGYIALRPKEYHPNNPTKIIRGTKQDPNYDLGRVPDLVDAVVGDVARNLSDYQVYTRDVDGWYATPDQRPDVMEIRKCFPDFGDYYSPEPYLAWRNILNLFQYTPMRACEPPNNAMFVQGSPSSSSYDWQPVELTQLMISQHAQVYDLDSATDANSTRPHLSSSPPSASTLAGPLNQAWANLPGSTIYLGTKPVFYLQFTWDDLSRPYIQRDAEGEAGFTFVGGWVQGSQWVRTWTNGVIVEEGVKYYYQSSAYTYRQEVIGVRVKLNLGQGQCVRSREILPFIEVRDSSVLPYTSPIVEEHSRSSGNPYYIRSEDVSFGPKYYGEQPGRLLLFGPTSITTAKQFTTPDPPHTFTRVVEPKPFQSADPYGVQPDIHVATDSLVSGRGEHHIEVTTLYSISDAVTVLARWDIPGGFVYRPS